jgi:hypothetical protein
MYLTPSFNLVCAMSFDRHSVPLPLAFHLASYSVIGLFCAFAGSMNLIDPGHILSTGVPLMTWTGFSWGYVFGILMGRTEVIPLGFLASLGYLIIGVRAWTAGFWKFAPDWRLGMLLIVVGLLGLFALATYRKRIAVA